MTANGTLRALFIAAVALATIPSVVSAAPSAKFSQGQSGRTPLQQEIENQQRRLLSGDVEERRDAVTRLGVMHHPDASRAAVPAVKDAISIVRATAASAILSLPPEEATGHLISMLSDKDEFVRREAAYALGTTRSSASVAPLADRLLFDKEDGVRSAAAVALGQIGNPAAVLSLVSALDPRPGSPSGKKSKAPKPEKNVFVLRAVARSLGQIKNNVALPALVGLLKNDKTEDDVKREAAIALGLLGDPAAIPALREVLTARDPHLASAAMEAIRRLSQPRGTTGS